MSITTTTDVDPVTALLTRAATDPAFDAEKFSIAVTFLRERESRAAHRAFNDAMAAAQAEMRAVPKDRANDYLRSRYATLSGMLSVVLPACAAHGLNVRFGSAPASQPGWQCVTCIVSLGDHVETTSLEGPIVTGTGAKGGQTQMVPIQATGSTTTYLKRYLIGMVFALVLSDEQDDDGESTRRAQPIRTAPPPLAPEAPPDDDNDARWRAYVAKLKAACEAAESRADVVALGARDSVRKAFETGPAWVVRDVSDLLADGYQRFPDEGATDLGPVEIAGAANLAAG